MRILASLAMSLVVLSLTACGGDNGKSPSSDDPPQFTATATAGAGGSISPTSRTVNSGQTTTFTVTPDTGFSIADVTGCNGSRSGNTYTTGALTANCTVTASFEINVYKVATDAGDGGTIDPDAREVEHGQTTTFEILPEVGYEITNVEGCDGSLSGSTWTTGPVTGACTVSATFGLLALDPPANLVATAGSGQVTVSWDEVQGAVAYNVYYGTEPDIDIATAASYDELLLDRQSPTMVDGLTDGTEYFFVVTAIAGPAESGASAEVSATPQTGASASFFGGGTNTPPRAVIVHPFNGDVYMIGSVAAEVPVTPGAWITNPRSVACGGNNIFFTCAGFLARFTPDLSELVAATYLPNNLYWDSVIVDPVSGDLFLAGGGGGLIGTPGSYQPTAGGNADGRLVRLRADLSAAVAATNYGDINSYFFTGLALAPPAQDPDTGEAITGDLYVLGYTSSTNAPGVAGGAQPTSGGGQDALVLRFSPDLSTLHQATYLGGSNTDWGASNQKTYPGIVVHPDSSDVYVANSTASTNFPTTPGAWQPTAGAVSTHGYVTRFNAGLTEILSSTYVSGNQGSSWNVTGLAVNAAGEIVIAGRDYVARLTPDLSDAVQRIEVRADTQVIQSLTALTIDSASGDVLVAGLASPTADLPALAGAILEEVPNAEQFTGAGFITRLDGSLTQIRQSSWIGPLHEGPFGLALDEDSEWVYTSVQSPFGLLTYPFGDTGAFPTNPGGGRASVVSRMRSTLAR